VKGSITGRDWYDDFTKIPFGNTRNAERYQQADKAYEDLQASGKPVDTWMSVSCCCTYNFYSTYNPVITELWHLL
jgi:hypothetical protein